MTRAACCSPDPRRGYARSPRSGTCAGTSAHSARSICTHAARWPRGSSRSPRGFASRSRRASRRGSRQSTTASTPRSPCRAGPAPTWRHRRVASSSSQWARWCRSRAPIIWSRPRGSSAQASAWSSSAIGRIAITHNFSTTGRRGWQTSTLPAGMTSPADWFHAAGRGLPANHRARGSHAGWHRTPGPRHRGLFAHGPGSDGPRPRHRGFASGGRARADRRRGFRRPRPPSDPLALSGALAHLASDPTLRARLGANAKARVAERFSIARMVDSTTRVYRELTKRA